MSISSAKIEIRFYDALGLLHGFVPAYYKIYWIIIQYVKHIHSIKIIKQLFYKKSIIIIMHTVGDS